MSNAVQVRDVSAGTTTVVELPEVLTVEDILKAAGGSEVGQMVVLNGSRVEDLSTEVQAGSQIILAPMVANG